MKKYNYLSLFSGAGGLDIGLEQSGLNAVFMCEIEKVFCDTIQSNSEFRHSDGRHYFSNAAILNSDIRDLASSDLSFGKDIDLVVGGPPCQAFSSSGKQLSVLDPQGAIINEFSRIVDEIKPKMFLLENVRGLITARNAAGEPGGVISGLLKTFHDIGYSCRAQLLNAADYGAYQRRVRCFIIGTRQGTAPFFPDRTHDKNVSLIYSPWKTLDQFLVKHADVNDCNYVYPTAALKKQLSKLPNGSGLKSKGKIEKTRPGGHWGYRQGTFIADLMLPARTVTGSSSQDWVRWNNRLRRLTFNEIKLLQGFPDDWTVLGTKTQRFKQVGNAVPSVLGAVLGKTIINFLNTYPTTSAKYIAMPNEFEGYINYTKKDHERNKQARSVHKNFTQREAI